MQMQLFVVGSFVAASAAKVDHLPRPGESLTARSFALEAGGKGFNLAVACKRLGARVSGVLPIGDDMLSGLAAPALERAGLPAAMLQRFSGATAAGIGFIDAAGENCLAVYPGANGLLGAGEIEAKADEIAAADLVLAQFEVTDAPIVAAFGVARAAGRRTLLNPSPYRAIPEALLALTSILILNAPEAAAMASSLGMSRTRPDGAPDAGFAAALSAAIMEKGPDIVVLTMGAQGAFLCLRGYDPLYEPAFAIETVDTLGAGDGFASGFAVAVAGGSDWPQVMRLASACGAMVSRRWGVFDAFPSRSEAEAFIGERSP